MKDGAKETSEENLELLQDAGPQGRLDGGEDPRREVDAGTSDGDSQEGIGRPVGAESGYVYFIETEDGRYVKIGYSTRVYRRLSELSTLRPGNFAIRMLGYFPGTPSTEKWLHAKFLNDRDNGEWFRSTPELRSFIAIMGLIPVITHSPRRPRNQPKAKKQCKEKILPASPIKLQPHEVAGYVKSEAATIMARMGAEARSRKLTPERRSEIARKAGLAGGRGRPKTQQ